MPLQFLKGNTGIAQSHAAWKPWTEPLHKICGLRVAAYSQGRERAGQEAKGRPPPTRPSWCELLLEPQSRCYQSLPSIQHSVMTDRGSIPKPVHCINRCGSVRSQPQLILVTVPP